MPHIDERTGEPLWGRDDDYLPGDQPQDVEPLMFTTSSTTAKLDAALAKAQGEIEHAVKDKTNPAFRSKYADLTSVWEACRTALTKNGISVTQWPMHSGDSRLHILTRVAHGGEWMQAHFSLPVNKQDAHGYASGTTYAKRLALSAAIGVVADEDDDGNAASTKPSNGHAVHDEPQRSTMQGRKTEADAIKNAREWVNAEALPAIAKIKTKDEYNAWNQANTKILDKLKTILPDEHDAIEARLSKKLDQLEPLAAG